MTSQLTVWKAQYKLTNPDGTATKEFLNYLNRGVNVRAGGFEAMTNLELAEAVQSLIAGEMVFQPAVADQLFVDIVQPFAPSDLGEMTFQR